MHRGYLAVWRKVEDHPFYKERRVFSKYEAWIDLLMNTQHKKDPQDVIFGMKKLVCHYGESLKSLKTWGIRWGWSPTKVKRFLDLLQDMNQIVYGNETITTRITVLNYSIYDPRCNADVTQTKRKRNGSETEALTDKNDKNVKNNPHTPKKFNKEDIERIVVYLNRKTNSSYKPESKATMKHIKARFNEGYVAEDFKTVIDHCCKKWLSDEKMHEYLRPQTLFNQKFEGYLNAAKRETEPAKKTKEQILAEHGLKGT